MSNFKIGSFFTAMLLTAVIYIPCPQAQTVQLPDFTQLVSKNAAAVVNISTTIKINGSVHGMQPMPNIPEDSPFNEFFRRFFGEMPDGSRPHPDLEQESLGSGFIISEDGYIITNHHVVKDAEEIIVRLVDRREFIARIIGADGQSDIAVLKIDGTNLPTVQLGDSDKLKVGEWVMAIGSPFQFDHSVTAGIVSAKGRPLPNENYVPFIQTDVAINPGNSGGPLFNLDGEVVGVNSQIYSRTGGFMGLSFAVPINLVKNVYQQLKDHGNVTRGWLGVLIQSVDRELAETFGMERPYGALITKVLTDSPAESAGFEIGDVIVTFNNREVINDTDLPPMVGGTEIGKTVPIDIIRRGKRQTLEVKIEVLPDDTSKIASKSTDKPDQSPANQMNIVVIDLTQAQLEELDLDHGVLIEGVKSGPASRAGLLPGDVLLLINNEKVQDVKRFESIITGLPKDKPVAILVQRRGNPIFLALKLDDAKTQ
ncbi:MAG: Periplasmic serine endoprotease DegP-like [Gammaproteobacteria bacterium]|nr:serine peptidase [Gammaproteobacteria bacterium]MBM2830654.1 Periplasmic serine endoprotease DegP-like [Gammaproteobacteria bacterium]